LFSAAAYAIAQDLGTRESRGAPMLRNAERRRRTAFKALARRFKRGIFTVFHLKFRFELRSGQLKTVYTHLL
jgi:hypothetical protein